MSLTFQGHMTSSVTWPFDTPYAIPYWWQGWIQKICLDRAQPMASL